MPHGLRVEGKLPIKSFGKTHLTYNYSGSANKCNVPEVALPRLVLGNGDLDVAMPLF